MGKLGKVAVITGGSSGMRLATARRVVAEGAHVYIMGRRRAALDAAVKQIRSEVTGVRGDIAKLADLDRRYEMVGASKELVDVVFCQRRRRGSRAGRDHLQRAFRADLQRQRQGMLFTVQKALPLLRDGGSIIRTGSIAGVKGLPGFDVHSAGKAAIRSFVRTWTVELKDRKIRANVISPGTIDTPVLAGLPNELIA